MGDRGAKTDREINEDGDTAARKNDKEARVTTEKGGESLCKWFNPLRGCNVCLIDGGDIEEATRIKYCVGNWQVCELYQSPGPDDCCDCGDCCC